MRKYWGAVILATLTFSTLAVAGGLGAVQGGWDQEQARQIEIQRLQICNQYLAAGLQMPPICYGAAYFANPTPQLPPICRTQQVNDFAFTRCY